ncbi:MAG: TatD family hydrolase [Clostridiales bacterium]|nr:TatD family hydrolase [Clostridiales bacterium]
MLIDTHAHITDEKYGDGGKGIIEAMPRDNLEAIICIGCDRESSLAAVEVAKNPNVYAAVGVHPYYPEIVTNALMDEFKSLAQNEKVVAIGEFGLDYHHDEYDRDAQIKAMAMQYELARELKLPMVFHVRAATGDFIDFIRDKAFPEGGVMHCFAGSVETADICVKKGLYIAFGGKLTYRNSKTTQEVAKKIPLDMILLETDAPYLTPVEKIGQVNYPAFVSYVRDKIAELRGMTADEVESVTTKNAKTLFKRIK